MKYIKVFLLCVFASAILDSCDNILDNVRSKEEQQAQTSPYMGRWIGNYSGDENGTLVLDIKKSGSVEVIRSSGGMQDTYYTSLSGGASFFNTPSPNTGFTLFGNMETHSGTWKMSNSKGSWSVTKQ